LRRAGAVIVLSAVASVGLGFVHPFGNPRVERPKGRDTLLRMADVPADAKKVLIAKCADCHSAETRWPVYARMAPGSWLIERDIIEARKKLNLSSWERMSTDSQDVVIAKIIHEAKSGDMPPSQYRFLHWGASLSAIDVAALVSMSKLEPGEESLSVPGDAARGKLIFQRRCVGCHASDGDREGPNLAGVFGRKAGSRPGFDYSAGLKNSGLTWNEATLEKWLKEPSSVEPDTKMDAHVAKAQERSDLIAYLKQ
jgi:cytochrome c